MEWKTIDSAPKDGDAVLLGWGDGDHIPCVGYWSEMRKMWIADRYHQWGGMRAMRQQQPSHWMQLKPLPPFTT